MSRRHPEMATLPDATAWLRGAWQTLPLAPLRVHVRDIEDGSQLGAHRFSTAMWRILTSSPEAYETVTETDVCYHPGQRHDDPIRDCQLCHGDGVRQFERARYHSPMAAALRRLSRITPPASGPSSLEVVVTYAWSGWDLAATASRLGIPPSTAQAVTLLAIRRLYERHSSGPIATVSWVDKSEAQQQAESWTTV